MESKNFSKLTSFLLGLSIYFLTTTLIAFGILALFKGGLEFAGGLILGSIPAFAGPFVFQYIISWTKKLHLISYWFGVTCALLTFAGTLWYGLANMNLF